MPVSGMMRSRDRGRDADLFEIIYGDNPGNVLRYTNSERDVVWNAMTFTAIPITHSGLDNKGRDSGTPIKVTVPSNVEAARLFQGVPPRRLVFFRLWMGDVSYSRTPSGWVSEGIFNLVFSGNVIESSRKGQQTILTCDTLGAGMKRPGLGRFYQRECTHVLYGERCRADKLAAEHATTVSSIVSREVTLASGWAGTTAISDFRGGLAEWTSDRGKESAFIVNVAGDTITLDYAPYGLAETDAISVFLGCPRTFDACTNLHNNAVNFGGQFGIPDKSGDPFFDNIYI